MDASSYMAADPSGYTVPTGDTNPELFDASGNYLGSSTTDASGNNSSSSFTLRFNGSTIEQGQNVLLSYANTDTSYTFSGIKHFVFEGVYIFSFSFGSSCAIANCPKAIAASKMVILMVFIFFNFFV
jgi:hypothetical protein